MCRVIDFYFCYGGVCLLVGWDFGCCVGMRKVVNVILCSNCISYFFCCYLCGGGMRSY